ncbi:MAG: hypothetical protein Kow0069_05010 [Promethearchaeota archaeon]
MGLKTFILLALALGFAYALRTSPPLAVALALGALAIAFFKRRGRGRRSDRDWKAFFREQREVSRTLQETTRALRLNQNVLLRLLESGAPPSAFDALNGVFEPDPCEVDGDELEVMEATGRPVPPGFKFSGERDGRRFVRTRKALSYFLEDDW